MNKKKMTILGTAFVVAVVALAGIGYAAAVTNYTAQSDNTANTAESTYIVMTQTEYSGVFDGSVYYNTSTAANGTVTYTQIKDDDTYGTLLGTGAVIVTPTNAAGDTYKISMQKTLGTAAAGTYTIVVTDAGAKVTSVTVTSDELATAFDITTDITLTSAAQTSTVKVYYLAGAGTPAATPLSGVTFQFVATATVAS